jgi:hypothetical protein
MHSTTVHDLSNVAHICDESQILHAAAGILRRQISDIIISDDEYPAISVVVCVLCNFPFDQRAEIEKKVLAVGLK